MTKNELTIIAAASTNNIIGLDNKLVWDIPRDLKRFKDLTQGHSVIMGRKTFESLPKPLPNRTNIVVTRQAGYFSKGCITVNSVEDGLKIAQQNGEKEPFIIGGGQIYKIALERDLVDKIYLTKVHCDFKGDTFFPELGTNWQETQRIDCTKDKNHAYNYSFLTFKKIK